MFVREGVRELIVNDGRSTVTIFPSFEDAQSVFHLCVLEGMVIIVFEIDLRMFLSLSRLIFV